MIPSVMSPLRPFLDLGLEVQGTYNENEPVYATKNKQGRKRQDGRPKGRKKNVIWGTKSLVPTTVALEPCIRPIIFHEDRLALDDLLALRRGGIAWFRVLSSLHLHRHRRRPRAPSPTPSIPLKLVIVAHTFHSPAWCGNAGIKFNVVW